MKEAGLQIVLQRKLGQLSISFNTKYAGTVWPAK